MFLARVWWWKAKIKVNDLIRELQDEDVNDNSDDESQEQNCSHSQMHDSARLSHHIRYAYHIHTLPFSLLHVSLIHILNYTK